MIAEAQWKAPLETGGVLLGWLGAASQELVAMEMVGPGPRAVHRRSRFRPDTSWQRRRIADLYETSGRRLSYLGDWHSHPGGGQTPSGRDERTARRIARHRAARRPQPLMLILAGAGEHWTPAPYRHVDGRLWPIELELTAEIVL